MEPASGGAGATHDEGTPGGGRGHRGLRVPACGPLPALQPSGRLAPAHDGRCAAPDPDLPTATLAHSL
eukprot:8391922-Lingulodinium_polyedra.AAC.1